MGQHVHNGARPPQDCLGVCMNRAFGPPSRYCLHSWGVAPDTMDRALSPVEMVNGQFPSQRVDQRPICPIVRSNLEVRTKSTEGADHNSLGQRPRKCRNERGTRAESPLYRLICINSSARSGGARPLPRARLPRMTDATRTDSLSACSQIEILIRLIGFIPFH